MIPQFMGSFVYFLVKLEQLAVIIIIGVLNSGVYLLRGGFHYTSRRLIMVLLCSSIVFARRVN